MVWQKFLVNGEVLDRLGCHLDTLVLVIGYKSAVQFVVGDQSMQAYRCPDDILQQGHISFLLFPWVLPQTETG